ncbi:putative lipid-binding transport protein (Tim44 family) [Paraburkholderia sp. GAS448]|uniref:Tim44 domain-containing protein n=1 Tax=Paraburkholderia sp. GAS448 TaxID=3035136 RepID=UPI003D205218
MSDSRSLFAKKSFRSMGGRIALVAMIGLVATLTLTSLDAEAQRRMGGGRSIGRQSQSAQRQSTPPAQQTPQQATQPSQAQRAQPAPTPTPAPSRSRWLGPIAGLAAGLGIAALLSHLGLGEGLAGSLANVIIIALIAMVVIWLIRRFLARRRNRDMSAPGTVLQSSMIGEGFATSPAQDPRYPMASSDPVPGSRGDASSTPEGLAVPPDFDSEVFLRSAKVCFVRLQAAWDEGNMADIREFTTPEMFAEVKLDLDARGTERSQTDVVQLDADLLNVEQVGDQYFASVRFHGLIRETAGAGAEPFVEIWNMSRSRLTQHGWLLAGIQQITRG